MDEAWQALPFGPEKVASWTKLSIDKFADVYENARIGTSAPTWPQVIDLSGLYASPEDLILEACRVAQSANFFESLTKRILEVEHNDRTTDADQVSLGQLIKDVPNYGQLQTIVQPILGLSSGKSIFAMANSALASAIVQVDGQPVGSATLVAPDLVLTAAHVALKIGGDQTWLPELQDDISFLFKKNKSHEDFELISILPETTSPIVWSSMPYAVPPQDLKPNISEPHDSSAAKTCLDSVLIRLNQVITHIEPVDIKSVSRPPFIGTVFSIGFPGGTAIKWGHGPIVEYADSAGRIIHQANTSPGMSGGIYVHSSGDFLGIHEGAHGDYKASGGQAESLKECNRGICLLAIREAQKSTSPDPLLTTSSAHMFRIDSQRAANELYNKGLVYVGPSNKDTWDYLVNKYLGNPAERPLEMPPFHALIPRLKLQTWLGEGTRNSVSRVFAAIGKRGTGRSFYAEIVRSFASGHASGFTYVSATQVSSLTWESAISQVLKASSPDDTTSLAHSTYQTIPSVIQALRRTTGPTPGAGELHYIVIDFSMTPNFGSDGENWRKFFEALMLEQWIRLLVICHDFEDADSLESIRSRIPTMARPSDIVLDQIQPLTWLNLAEFVHNLEVANNVGSESTIAKQRTRLTAVISEVEGFFGGTIPVELETTIIGLIATGRLKGLYK